MTILYTVIGRKKDATMLVEVADTDIKGGNMKQIFISMFEYFRDNPTAINDGDRKSYVQRNQQDQDFFSYFVEACTSAIYTDPCSNDSTTWNNDKSDSESPYVAYEPDEYYIHVYLKDGIFYTCLSDDDDTQDHKVSFAYLETLQGDFIKMFRQYRITNVKKENALEKQFTPTVRSIVHYHNTHHNEIRMNNKTKVLLAQINDMKSVMGRNIKLLIEREHTMGQLTAKSNELEDKVQVFKKRARQNLRQKQFSYYRTNTFLCVLIVVCIYIGIAIPCGIFFRRCTVKVNNRRLQLLYDDAPQQRQQQVQNLYKQSFLKHRRFTVRE